MAKLKYHNGQEWEQLAPNMEEYNTTKGMIGTLANLLTTAKNNLVVAINEIFGWVEDVETDLETHKAETTTNAHFANNIGISSQYYESEDVEGALEEAAKMPMLTGEITINQSIPASTQITKTINVGEKKRQGVLISPGSTVVAGVVFFGSTSDAAYSIWCQQSFNLILSKAAGDIRLSDNLNGTNGRIRIADVYITGTNLRITLENISASEEQTIDITLYWEVW